MERAPSRPLKLFYCYAHEDRELRNTLEKHLAILHRLGLVEAWHDGAMSPGTHWEKAIVNHLNAAHIILLLISADFMKSENCYHKEMKLAIERHCANEVRVIPILLRSVHCEGAPFSELQMLPSNGVPITSWSNNDEAYTDVAEGIHLVVTNFLATFHTDHAQTPRSLAASFSQSSHRTSEAPTTQRETTHSTHVRQYHAYLLKLVDDIWIRGVLKHSLYQDVLMQLGLREEPSEIANPFRLTVQETDLPAYQLTVDSTITTIYKEASGRLLILGEPGAGKTTSLLELARELLQQAKQSHTSALPVIFPLSSWAEQCQQLDRWLIEELHAKYAVPLRLAERWMKTEQIIPLLDGLDEVAESVRVMCVIAINNYCRDHPLQSLVVCCRRVEYEALRTRVALRKAVLILPLTRKQIDEYFTHLGASVAAQRQLFLTDSELQDLITTPLLLNIFTLAYQGVTIQEFSENRFVGSLRQRLFAQYVQRMFIRRAQPVPYTQEQTIGWLTWLASQLKSNNLTVFYLESLESHWLPSLGWERLYRIINALVIGSLVGLGFGLLGWLTFGLTFGVGAGLVLTFTLASGQIRGSQAVSWSWRLVWKRRYQSLTGLLIGPLLGLLVWKLDGPLMGLFFGLLIEMGVGLSSGLSVDQSDLRFRTRANSGVLRSTRNGLIGGLSFGLSFGLIGGLLSGLIGGLGFGLVGALGFWLIGGTSVGVITGGFAYFQQRLLLILLRYLKKIPRRNYRHFLDYATERVLLRQVGTGYMFVHGLLMDYFTTLAPSLDFSKEASSTNTEP